MTANDATGRVCITKIPESEAPLWVRAAWFGLELPAYPIAGCLTELAFGVVSGLPIARGMQPYVIVPQAEALAILEQESPEAARWWRDHGYPTESEPNFCFRFDEVHIISGVKLREIIHVTDEMMGDPGR